MQKHKGIGLLSSPQRQRCCARCPKPFTVIVATLIIALVLIIGLLIGHFAAPYIGTMVRARSTLPFSRPWQLLLKWICSPLQIALECERRAIPAPSLCN